MLAFHQGEPGSVPSWVTGFLQVGIVPDVGGVSRGSPFSPAISFRRSSIFNLVTFIGSQNLAVKSSPNILLHMERCAIADCVAMLPSVPRSKTAAKPTRIVDAPTQSTSDTWSRCDDKTTDPVGNHSACTMYTYCGSEQLQMGPERGASSPSDVVSNRVKERHCHHSVAQRRHSSRFTTQQLWCPAECKAGKHHLTTSENPGGEQGSPLWEAGSLTTTPPRPLCPLCQALSAMRNGFDSRRGRPHISVWHVGIVPDDTAGRRVFSWIFCFPVLALRRCYILIGSQVLDVKRRANIFTHFQPCTLQMSVLLLMGRWVSGPNVSSTVRSLETVQVAQERRDWEGMGHGLCLGPIPAFAWSDFGKPRKTEIRMAGPEI
ncbi:hypothetical protein PR048_021486 [Dryococelus australis]|uniref:Uncharacterized protein n=1 Tax=Dryococelus australis TaxID=614101 RepID=A0ABQ9GYD9_9NEOP|nr:hypothetical protein PR048_021486 [Dryococelus australis]